MQILTDGSILDDHGKLIGRVIGTNPDGSKIVKLRSSGMYGVLMDQPDDKDLKTICD